MILPVGEETDAVGTRKNIVKMVFQLRQREILVNDLPHLKSWLHVERDLGDDTQPAQSDDCAGKPVAVFLPGQGHDLAISRDDFHRRDSR